MARPFISWISRNEEEMVWLRDILSALGFEQPIVLGTTGSPFPVLREIQTNLARADCLFALVGPTEDNRIRDWMQYELNAAMTQQIPIGALVAPEVRLSEEMQAAFIWQHVDFSTPKAIVKASPAIIQLALKIQRIVDGVDSGAPAIFEEVHVLDSIRRDTWEHSRAITLSAGLGFQNEVEHVVDCGKDRTPGLSVKLADPQRDLQFSCRDRPGSTCTVEQNHDDQVTYTIKFEPHIRRGDNVRYRVVSRHPNIFPLTREETARRVAKGKAPIFMAEGLVGDIWEIRKPTERLILELETDLDLGFTAPELRVYVVHSDDEILAERERIGNPRVAPRLWEVREDEPRNKLLCRVTIPRPVRSCVYALLARPPG
jgi:hypothetical protein